MYWGFLFLLHLYDIFQNATPFSSFRNFFCIQLHAARFVTSSCVLLSFHLSCILMVSPFSVTLDSIVALVGVRENPFDFAQSNK